MSFQSKRELLAQTAPRYREASHAQKSLILDEFSAATGYARKYAIRLLRRPVAPPFPIKRPRPPHYGKAVQEALTTAWAAANYICAKRLIPFLPTLIPQLERHGHLQLSDQVRAQLLAISPATADRLLRAARQADRPAGKTTTQRGALLKHQIPIRTFQDWNETTPGFCEADLVAHCGWSSEGSYLQTLVITDIATGWTECQALLHRSQQTVLQALERARQLLPFPLLGFDTDNGKEFINAELLLYCEQAKITFTRGRTANKNDQCYVEQKNGAIVRQIVGYDRFEGEQAYRQLTELYRAARLYVNFFQPSMKLVSKQRDGARVRRTYDQAQTPFQRLLASNVLTAERRMHLETLFQSLDPVQLLRQLETLQEALWRHAVFRTPAPTSPTPLAPAGTVPFDAQQCGPTTNPTDPAVSRSGDADASASAPAVAPGAGKRKYHRSKKSVPHTWRTRPDPFVDVWDEICERLSATPERTAKSLFVELQQRYPGRFPDVQLRTLQRRIKAWREKTILAFDDQWLQQEVLIAPLRAPVLRVVGEHAGVLVEGVRG